MAKPGGPACKVCDSRNTVSLGGSASRELWKCLDCEIRFYIDFEDEIKIPSNKLFEKVPVNRSVLVANKTYLCKKCPFTTPDKGKLVGHYASVHSWRHNPKYAGYVYGTLLERIGRAYKSGVTPEALAKKYHRCRSTIYRLLDKAGIPRRKRSGRPAHDLVILPVSYGRERENI